MVFGGKKEYKYKYGVLFHKRCVEGKKECKYKYGDVFDKRCVEAKGNWNLFASAEQIKICVQIYKYTV